MQNVHDILPETLTCANACLRNFLINDVPLVVAVILEEREKGFVEINSIL
jgi:hypothetical protein